MKKTRRNQAIRSSDHPCSWSRIPRDFQMYTGLILRVHLECAGLVSFPFLQGLKSQMKVRPRARLYVYSVSNPSVVTRRGGPVGHLQPGRLVVNGPRSRYRFRSKTEQSESTLVVPPVLQPLFRHAPVDGREGHKGRPKEPTTVCEARASACRLCARNLAFQTKSSGCEIHIQAREDFVAEPSARDPHLAAVGINATTKASECLPDV